MNMRYFEKYIGQTEFSDYADFKENFKVNPPKDFNFSFDVVDAIAQEDPDRLAMQWCDDKGNARRFTFKDMSVMSAKTANYFRSLGIGKGDVVMLVLKRHYEFWYSILALHKLGAVVAPATNLLMKKDIVYRTNQAKMKMVVCTNDGVVADEIDKSRPEIETVEQYVIARGERDGWDSFEAGVEAASPVFERSAGDQHTTNTDPSILFFSSGTTGMPKMVLHDFNYPLGHIVTASYWQDVVEDGLHLTVADTGWGKALWGKLYAQWMAKTAVFTYDYDKFVPSDLLKLIEKYKITSFCAPPTIYRFFIKEDLSQYDLSSLKHGSIAGEALNPEIFNRFFEATGVKLREAFGQTETTVTVGTFKMMEPVPGSMGKPAPGYDLEIIDDSNRAVPIGTIGEIAVRMPKEGEACSVGMCIGYYRDEELTAKVFGGDWYRTGDMAWRDENGYFWYVGRADDVIKSSGYRIGPFEVESALMEHPAVLETAITAVPDEVRGNLVKATVVLAQGYTPSDELKKELQDHVKCVTAPYKYPRIVEFVEELPKTISGKIRRVEIREKDGANYRAEGR